MTSDKKVQTLALSVFCLPDTGLKKAREIPETKGNTPLVKKRKVGFRNQLRLMLSLARAGIPAH